MSYTIRSCPPSSSFAAIGWPMLPTPKYPTFIAALRRIAIGLVEAATDRPRLHGWRFPVWARSGDDFARLDPHPSRHFGFLPAIGHNANLIEHPKQQVGPTHCN